MTTATEPLCCQGAASRGWQALAEHLRVAHLGSCAVDVIQPWRCHEHDAAWPDGSVRCNGWQRLAERALAR